MSMSKKHEVKVSVMLTATQIAKLMALVGMTPASGEPEGKRPPGGGFARDNAGNALPTTFVLGPSRHRASRGCDV